MHDIKRVNMYQHNTFCALEQVFADIFSGLSNLFMGGETRNGIEMHKHLGSFLRGMFDVSLNVPFIVMVVMWIEATIYDFLQADSLYRLLNDVVFNVIEGVVHIISAFAAKFIGSFASLFMGESAPDKYLFGILFQMFNSLGKLGHPIAGILTTALRFWTLIINLILGEPVDFGEFVTDFFTYVGDVIVNLVTPIGEAICRALDPFCEYVKKTLRKASCILNVNFNDFCLHFGSLKSF